MHRKVHVRFGPGATGKGSANRYLASGLPVLTATTSAAPPGTQPRPVVLSITTANGELTIRVWDPDPTPPTPRQPVPGDTDEHGRGLIIVNALSTRWGTHPAHGGGKYVWAAIHLHTQPGDRPPTWA